jgi:hypothetical protein
MILPIVVALLADTAVGVINAWWYRSAKGSTLSKLHHDWRAGTTIRGALTAGRRMGWLGFACILSTAVVVGQSAPWLNKTRLNMVH